MVIIKSLQNPNATYEHLEMLKFFSNFV